jgi:tetratricopeptide (TPR) repeat protein
VFSREQVASLSAVLGDVAADRGGEDVAAVLGDLVRMQILSQTSSRLSSEFGQYQFVQDVVRQVAYATLSRRDRRTTHLAVAKQIESENDEAGDLAPIIAQHYLDAIEAMPAESDVADLEARAIAHLERAAQRARSLGAMSESAGHLMVALARASDPAIKARLQSAAAWALADWGESERAIPLAAAAAEAFDALGDPVSAGVAAAAQGTALGQLGDNTSALELIEPRYAALIDVPDAERAVLLLSRTLITAEVRIGGQVRRDVMNRQIQIAEKIGDQAELAACLSGLSLDFYWMGAAHTGGVLMEAAADLARKHHLPEALARCLNNLTVDYNLKDLAKAVELGREGVEVARRTGMGIWQTFTALNLALGLLAAGGWDEAESVLEDAPTRSTMDRVTSPAILGYLQMVRGEPFTVPWEEGDAPVTDDTAEQAWRSFCLAVQALSHGEDAEALARAVEAVELMNEATGLSDDLVHMWPMAADLAIGSADLVVARSLLSLVDDASARMQVPLGVQAHRQRVAGLLAKTDEPAHAVELLRKAVDEFATWGARPFQARTEIELGRLLVAQGDVEQGGALVERGRTVLEQLGAAAWLRDLETAPVVG